MELADPIASAIEPIEPEERGAVDWPLIRAVLRRIEEALASFIERGQAGAIDLRGVPHMDAATYQSLRETLGTGEVSATVNADIRVEVRESRYPGVWWLTHINERGAKVTEVIEITEVPAILRSHVTDMRIGLERLQQTGNDAAD
jgi:hydrogenase-1 operon protein HyaF